jgi:integrase
LVGDQAVLVTSLWEAIDEWADTHCGAEATCQRYRSSFNILQERGVLSRSATIADLAQVDWRTLAAEWPNSGSDFNHLRRAVSKFLSDTLGDLYHPFRRSVIKKIPKRLEQKRVPDLPPAVFWKAVERSAEWAQPIFVTLVASGMRVGEYLRCEEIHLLPHTHSIRVPGTKTEGSADVIRIDERLWPWITRAIPCPLGAPPAEWRGVQRDSRYKRLLKEWKRVCEAEGVSDPRLHDLRHCTGQWLCSEGVPEARLQAALRHATPSMTRRYSMQRDRGENARVMASVLLPEKPAISKRGA